jgi:hypothetical protein
VCRHNITEAKAVSIKIEVHGIESDGVCSLSEKQGEVMTVTFADGTVTEAALSLKAFVQLLRMKLGGKPKARAEPKQEPKVAVPLAAAAPGNGPAK